MTVSELKEWFEKLLSTHEEKDQVRHTGEHDAASVAALDLDRRLAEMNNFRQALTDQRGTMVNRDLHDKLEASMDARLKTVEQRIANFDGKLTMLGVSLGALFTLVQLALHFWVP